MTGLACREATEAGSAAGQWRCGSARRRTGTRTGRPDSGSVTVEAAIGLSALVIVLAMCLAGIVCLIAALRVTDAAGEAARLAARGDRAGASAVVARLAPDGSVLTLSASGELVTARVSAPPLGSWFSAIRVSATAVAAREGESPAP